MDFSLDNGQTAYRLHRYSNGTLYVDQAEYNSPIVITPQALLAPWGPTSIKTVSEDDIESLLSLEPQIVLIGTGETLYYLEPKRLTPLIEAQIGFEMMTTQAACRTYTVLMAEGRQVVACLFP